MPSYPGGKAGSGVYQHIINCIPPHVVYIEPFAGGAAIRRMMRPSRSSIIIDADPDVAGRLEGLKLPSTSVLNVDAISWLESRASDFTPEVVIYCDPPYPISARSTPKGIYACEMSDEDHVRFLRFITTTQARVLVSGYHHPLYDEALKDWTITTYKAMVRSGKQVTEVLWMNFPRPTVLHDTRYIGRNFRERERIKRLTDRWHRRFSRLDPLVQQRLIDRLLPSAGMTLLPGGPPIIPAMLEDLSRSYR